MGQSVSQGSLFPYGIQVEKSDIRCHVSPVTRTCFVFRTALALGLDLARYPRRSAGQDGVEGITAIGHLVPWRDIPDIRPVQWHSVPWWEWFDIHDSTSEKGKKAVHVTQELLRIGRFPLWLSDCEEARDATMQIRGTDMLVYGRWVIQIKCDWLAGDKKNGGSGNLFFQVAERNPLRRT